VAYNSSGLTKTDFDPVHGAAHGALVFDAAYTHTGTSLLTGTGTAYFSSGLHSFESLARVHVARVVTAGSADVTLKSGVDFTPARFEQQAGITRVKSGATFAPTTLALLIQQGLAEREMRCSFAVLVYPAQHHGHITR
jgi:hypothetical protein